MASVKVNVASISWIDKQLMSGFSSMPLNIFAADAWLNQLCYGMCHTANTTPPDAFDGETYASGVTLGKQYRSLTTFSVEIETGADGTLTRFRKAPGAKAVLDAGYTPPFDSGWELWKGIIGTSIITTDPMVTGKMHSEATMFSPGEQSSLSAIVLPGDNWQDTGVKPLDYSSIKVAAGEIVLGHSLLKFRAGTQGDYIGVVAMGCPNHVPWVWCETILAYAAPNLVLYGAGSGFPCHQFYCKGQKQGRLNLTTDKSKLKTIFSTGLKASASMVMVPSRAGPRMVLTGINAQASMTEDAKGVVVGAQPYTAPANDSQVRQVVGRI